MDSTGNWLWVKKLEMVEVNRTFMGPNNGLIIAGELKDTSILGSDTLIPDPGMENSVLALLDSNGYFQWARTLNRAYIWDISTDGIGNTIVGGTISQNQTVFFDTIVLLTTSKLRGFVAKLDQTGKWEWANLAGKNTFSVTTTTSGSSWISGSYEDTTAFGSFELASKGALPNTFIGFLDQNGHWQWVTGTDTLGITTVTYDNVNDCLIHAGSIPNNPAIVLAKINSSGQWQWKKLVHGLNPNQTSNPAGNIYFGIFRLVAADSLGGAYMLGHSQSIASPVVFGTDTVISSGKHPHMYVSKINSSGQWEWAGATVTDGQTWPLSITYFNENNIYLSGRFDSKAFFGLDTLLLNPGSGGNFIAKFGQRQPLLLRPMKDSLIHCGDSVRLKTLSNSVAQLKYKWSPGTGMADSTEARPLVSPLDTTTYTLQAWRDTCSASGQVTINVDPGAAPVNLQFQSSTGNFKFCENGYTLSAPPGYMSYHWNTGDTGRSITPAKPGVYSVSLTNTRGCIVEDSVEIEPLVEVSSPSNFQLCSNIPNDSVQLVATSPADSYLWSTGDTGSAVWVSSPGPYWLTAWQDSCSYTDTLQVETLTDTANADFTYTLDGHFVHFAPVSKGVMEAHWTFGDGYSDIALTTSHRYQVMGKFTVCLATLDVCGYRDTVCKEIDLNSIGIEENPGKKRVEIYPNPASDIIHIEFSNGIRGSQLILTDLAGNIVSRHMIKKSNKEALNISHLSSGMYILRYKNHHQVFVKE